MDLQNEILRIRKILKSNKFFVTSLVITIVLTGLTFGNLPGPATSKGSQTINGTTFAFADYGSVDHEMLASFNYLDTLVNDKYQGYAEWDGFGITKADDYSGLEWALPYVLAFGAYATQMLFQTTNGYRTEYYRDFSNDLIMKMNTSESEYGEDSIEYMMWRHEYLNFDEYYWPNATDDSGLYVGDFRGPANIMWTAHYALMGLLHERNFNTGTMTDEAQWFVEDWNNSLTTDGFGNPQEGGIWENGLIPCEPYVTYIQCNTPPLAATALYDNLYDTEYLPIWDYGLDFSNTVMQDQYDLMSDGWYVYQPAGPDLSGPGWNWIAPDEFPGLATSIFGPPGEPAPSAYNIAWSIAFLEYVQESETAKDYPIFLDHYMKDISNDMAYIVEDYWNPEAFGVEEILATMFTLHLANQQGDYNTRDRLAKLFFGLYDKEWSADGRTMHYNTQALDPFLQPIVGFTRLWSYTPVTIVDLTDARPTGFWDYPYISAADDDSIWVYQAEWDPVK
ncbi:MAG: hypothetical protein ACXAB7_20745, partial [Candidatus Kariarchaeaceae archaeon]